MTVDPSLALQRAIYGILVADADVQALIQKRVYDDVPPVAAYPYVSFGPSQLIQQDADCITGFETFLQLDVWTREDIGFEKCKTICEAVRKALHRVIASQDGMTFEIEHQFTNTNRDPDGVTSHGVLSFRAEIDT